MATTRGRLPPEEEELELLLEDELELELELDEELVLDDPPPH
jgi:hypothetical protein